MKEKARQAMAQRLYALVDEEDPFIRSFVADKLMAMGYAVTFADASSMDRQEAAQFDLVLKDLPKPFSLDVFEWRLQTSRMTWQKAPARLAAGA